MAYNNNKKVGAICGCHITFCVQNQYLWFSKFPIFRTIRIYPYRFYLFLKCGILRNLFSIPQTPKKIVFSSLQIIHKEKLLRQLLWSITNCSKKKKNEKPPHISWSVYSEFLVWFTTMTSRVRVVIVFVTALCSLNYLLHDLPYFELSNFL